MYHFLFLACVALVCSQEEPDVVVLTTDSFDEVLKANEFVLVEFYAPWCGHCKKLAPEYSTAATTLKTSGSPVVLGKVDATVESSLGERFAVKGYPTLKFFRGGEPIEYDGGRTAADLVNWVTKKSGPPSTVLATKEALEAYIAGTGTRALAFVSEANLPAWETVAKGEKVQAFAFAHVSDAALFGDRKEGTIELHKDGEDVKTFDGEDAGQWIAEEGFPLVDVLAQESWTRAQNSGSDLLAVFVASSGDAASAAALEVAKLTKGKLVVTTSDQIGIGSRWGASGNKVPTAIYVSNKNAGQPSFVIWNEDTTDEFNGETLKAFVDGSVDGTYESWMKSEPIPESNDGPVTVLVGKTFDSIAKATGKDVLVEFYAPWCGHCKKLEPIYEELGTFYKNDDNIVIAKFDGTANGTPKGVSIQGFPTLIFFNANNEQVPYEGERELEAFKTWLEQNRKSQPAAAERDEL